MFIQEKQRDLREEDSEFGWSFHSENIVAVTGFKSGVNSCDFQVNIKGAQLVCHANPPAFHSLRISLCSVFNVCQAALPNNLLLPLDLDNSPSSRLLWLAVCHLSSLSYHFPFHPAVFFYSLSHYLLLLVNLSICLSFIVLLLSFSKLSAVGFFSVLCE